MKGLRAVSCLGVGSSGLCSHDWMWKSACERSWSRRISESPEAVVERRWQVMIWPRGSVSSVCLAFTLMNLNRFLVTSMSRVKADREDVKLFLPITRV